MLSEYSRSLDYCNSWLDGATYSMTSQGSIARIEIHITCANYNHVSDGNSLTVIKDRICMEVICREGQSFFKISLVV